MANLTPRSRSELAEFEPYFTAVERTMGFVPNSFFLMAYRPDILRAFGGLAGAVLGPGTVDGGLKQLVAHVASRSAGCRYCQAHTAHSAHRQGIEAAKLDAVWEFETSPLFDESERAALRLARDAALVPNETGPAHFEALGRHFDEGETVELMAVIALFGWLNRWNDTLATDLEGPAAGFAAQHLAGAGWEAGKHRT